MPEISDGQGLGIERCLGKAIEVALLGTKAQENEVVKKQNQRISAIPDDLTIATSSN